MGINLRILKAPSPEDCYKNKYLWPEFEGLLNVTKDLGKAG